MEKKFSSKKFKELALHRYSGKSPEKKRHSGKIVGIKSELLVHSNKENVREEKFENFIHYTSSRNKNRLQSTKTFYR